MVTNVVVMERMGEVVVMVRHRWGNEDGKDVQEQTVVLDVRAAHELCSELYSVLDKMAQKSKPPASAPEKRYYRVEARAGKGPRTDYVEASTADEAHKISKLSNLHPAELRIDRMMAGWKP